MGVAVAPTEEMKSLVCCCADGDKAVVRVNTVATDAAHGIIAVEGYRTPDSVGNLDFSVADGNIIDGYIAQCVVARMDESNTDVAAAVGVERQSDGIPLCIIARAPVDIECVGKAVIP